MNIADLPTEVLEIIFRHLPPVSLMSCSQAVPQFAQLINRDVFLDRYCQRLLQADWIKWEMLLATRKSFPLILEMWYLSAVTACHPNLILRSRDDLHSIGIFIYTLNTWLSHDATVSDVDVSEEVLQLGQCIECHETELLKFVITCPQTRQMIVKLAITVPEFINVTILNSDIFSVCNINPQLANGIINDLVDFKPKYYLEFSLLTPPGCRSVIDVPNGWLENWELPMSAFIVVGEEFWIGWRGKVKDYHPTYPSLTTEILCKEPICFPFSDTQIRFKDIFGIFSDLYETYGLSLWGWKETIELLSQFYRSGEPLWIRLTDLLEERARRVTKKTELLDFQKGSRYQLIQYLDNCLQKKSSHDTSYIEKPSRTLYVSILRYLHRVINNIFFSECERYLYCNDCCQYLAYDRKYSNTTFVNYSYLSITIHSLPPRLWPSHLLRHAISVVPVVSRLVQLDILLWTKDRHCHSISDKIRQFLIDQVRSCGLHCDVCDYPPLCDRVIYSHCD